MAGKCRQSKCVPVLNPPRARPVSRATCRRKPSGLARQDSTIDRLDIATKAIGRSTPRCRLHSSMYGPQIHPDPHRAATRARSAASALPIRPPCCPGISRNPAHDSIRSAPLPAPVQRPWRNFTYACALNVIVERKIRAGDPRTSPLARQKFIRAPPVVRGTRIKWRCRALRTRS